MYHRETCECIFTRAQTRRRYMYTWRGNRTQVYNKARDSRAHATVAVCISNENALERVLRRSRHVTCLLHRPTWHFAENWMRTINDVKRETVAGNAVESALSRSSKTRGREGQFTRRLSLGAANNYPV